jgi:hypothetical protein
MSLFTNPFTEIRKLIAELEELIKLEKNPYRLVLTQTINKSKFQIMSLSISSNQQVAGVLGLVDAVTGVAVTATFTGVTATSDTPAAATVNVDASNNINLIGVAAGSGNIDVSAVAAYTDSTGTAQSQTLTTTVPFVVTAVVTADAINLVVTFGSPTTQPASAK